MDGYEKTSAASLQECQKRSKSVIDGYKSNQDSLRQRLLMMVSLEDTVFQSEEKLESLKGHAKAQIEKKDMDGLEKTLAELSQEYDKQKENHETVMRHLATLEVEFSDVHKKCEPSKSVIDGNKTNKDTLRQALMSIEDAEAKREEKYQSLKAQMEKKVMDGLEKNLAELSQEYDKQKKNHETVMRHLATLEVEFSDVHKKCVIDGNKTNKDTLRQALMSIEDAAAKREEKYQSLKAQIEKLNQELQLIRDE